MTHNKTYYRNLIEKLVEKLEDLKVEFEDLKEELVSESADIEPYENHSELTTAQEERQSWLDDSADQVDNAITNIESALDDLSYIE